MSPKNNRLKFEAERLKNGPIVHEIDVQPEVLDLKDDPEYLFKEPVTATITAQLVGTSVLLTGSIKTIAAAPCARCLVGLRVPLQASLTLLYMQDERLRDPARYPELHDDNTYWYDGDIVYPAEQLREAILLQLPVVPHCELDENDICPIRNVHIEPMVFGADEEPAPELTDEAPAEMEDKSLGAQLKRLRRGLGPET